MVYHKYSKYYIGVYDNTTLKCFSRELSCDFSGHSGLIAIFTLPPPPLLPSDIASLAERHQDLLVPDEGAQYDRLVEINLDEVCDVATLNVYCTVESLCCGHLGDLVKCPV